MARSKLTLYLDIVSPFAYLAFYVTKNSNVFQKCDITYIPIFLGGVMKATGNTPPINIKNKAEWINIERLRWAKYCNIPVAQKTPEGFPHNTIQVQRALCAIEKSHPEKLTAALTALYDAFWVRGEQINKPEVWQTALENALGAEDKKSVVDSINSAEVKALLQKNTDRAIEDGAFGLPWFVATNSDGETEKFWGFDHLGQVIQHLGLERPENLRAML